MVTDSRYRILVPGRAIGAVITLVEPLSLWGGFDVETGRITDQSHPQVGLALTGGIVGMPYGRGSSSSSSVLAEAMRLGTAPAAFILEESDPILVIGALVAGRLYQASCPVLVGPIPMENTGLWEIDCDKSPPVTKMDH
jgi:predicted aconitase with swiveling domain